MAINDVAGEWVCHVWDNFSIREFLDHYFVSGLLTLKPTQVAQLSQRNRAAGWVSYGQMWKTGTGRQFTDIIIFNHCGVFGQQSNRIRRKTQN